MVQNIQNIKNILNISSVFLFPFECLKLLKLNKYLRNNLRMKPKFNY